MAVHALPGFKVGPYWVNPHLREEEGCVTLEGDVFESRVPLARDVFILAADAGDVETVEIMRLYTQRFFSERTVRESVAFELRNTREGVRFE